MPDRFTPLLFPEMNLEPGAPAPLPDADARSAALDTRRSFVVEAPAGSGKTGLLIQRFMKLLADDEVLEPEQVLAITFTKKAAGEIRDRVLAQLEKAQRGDSAGSDFERLSRELAGAVLKRDQRLGWRLLEQPFRLNLRTIDSVCAQIARSLPVLSGSAGILSPTDDGQPLYREAARRTLLLLGDERGDPSLAAALRDLLLHRDANLRDCEELISEMLSVRDQWGMLSPLDRESLTDEVLDREVLPKLQRTLEDAVCGELSALAAQLPGDLMEDLAPLAEQMSYAELYDPKISPLQACRGRKRAPGALAEDIAHWRALIHLLIKPSAPRDWRKTFAKNTIRFVMEKSHQERLKALIAAVSHRQELVDVLCRIEALPDPVYPPAQWAVAKSLFRVLRRALVELQLVFAERGVCDFTEVSLLARSALRGGAGPEEMAAALGTGAPGAGLQHLLVDEMQDTSSGQYELLQMLTQGWDGVSQTAFLVGDPRQSIYLFRQARVENFIHTLSSGRLGELGVERLQLTANFRSQRRLVEQFNEDFARVFQPGAGTSSGTALPYQAADAVLEETRGAEGRRWHARPVPLPSAAEVEQEIKAPLLRLRQWRRNARAVREVARRWMTKPLPAGRTEPWRIAVLVRNRRHLAEVVSEFQNEGSPGGRIPYKATEIEPLNERQEILDLLALTRALLHPADRAAGLALLRAPWCGLSLRDLLVLTGGDEDGFAKHAVVRLMEERGELLSPEGCGRMRRLWKVLEAAQRQRGKMSTAEQVERAWRSLGGDAALGEEELTNARRYFELLDEMEKEAGAPPEPGELDSRLKRLFAEPQTFSEGSSYVELSTMHRAKGLEWDVVVIPALERWPGRTKVRLLTWAELSSGSAEGSSMMLAPIAARGEEVDGLTRWLKRKYAEQEAAERKRLFYVAATRAREELHLMASPDRKASGEVKPAPASLLHAAWGAAEPYFAPTATLESVTVARLHVEPGVMDLAATGEVVVMPRRGVFGNGNGGGGGSEVRPEATEEPLYSGPTRPAIVRLPESVRPEEQFALAREQRIRFREQASADAGENHGDRDRLTRPEGSLAARSVGNAVHALLEWIAGRTSKGERIEQIAEQIAGWQPRVAALLRADGISPPEVARMSRDTVAALAKMLRDSDGSWVLSAHPKGGSEYALVGPGPLDEGLYSIRVDRLFMAGVEPGAGGEDYLWIVDYKTAAYSGTDAEEFLAEQKRVYAPQLEEYARVLSAERGMELERLRVGLYYTSVPRLVWWVPEDAHGRD